MLTIIEQFIQLLTAIQDNTIALFTLVAVPSLFVAAMALLVVWTAIRRNK